MLGVPTGPTTAGTCTRMVNTSSRCHGVGTALLSRVCSSGQAEGNDTPDSVPLHPPSVRLRGDAQDILQPGQQSRTENAVRATSREAGSAACTLPS